MDYNTLFCIKGQNLTLRLVRPEDAAYVYGLRSNPSFNEHLSKVGASIEDQRHWLEEYKTRESLGGEFYYIIERNNGDPCGTVRIYNITTDSFTWGSWILDHNKPPKAALESAVLSFSVGFKNLDLNQANVEVRKLNTHAANFYRRLGMIEIGQNRGEILFVYHRARFEADQIKYTEIIKEAANA